MAEQSDSRVVVFVDTNVLHYLSLFIGFACDNRFGVDDMDAGTKLPTRMRQVDDPGYRSSLRKGHKFVSFVLREDAQIEYSHFSMVELLCGRIRGAAIESVAREGVPERMWSKLNEKEIDRRSERDLQGIKARVDEVIDTLSAWNILFGSAPARSNDVLQLARKIVGRVYIAATDSIVYADAIVARADRLVTEDKYLHKTVNRLHNPGGNARFRRVAQELRRLGYGDLPQACSCSTL